MDELLVPSLVIARSSRYRYSNITLALLEDTGWYHVNYSQGEDLDWGKGAGCTFLSSECPQQEYCPRLGVEGCAFTRAERAVCTALAELPSCQILFPISQVIFFSEKDVFSEKNKIDNWITTISLQYEKDFVLCTLVAKSSYFLLLLLLLHIERLPSGCQSTSFVRHNPGIGSLFADKVFLDPLVCACSSLIHLLHLKYFILPL